MTGADAADAETSGFSASCTVAAGLSVAGLCFAVATAALSARKQEAGESGAGEVPRAAACPDSL